eukprot:9786973-Ditylum_brightwellii.AAC.1
MGNYFTLSKVCAIIRECGIGTIGTVRFRGNWPPASIQDINIKDATFNELFWSINEFGTLAVRWMDDGMVKFGFGYIRSWMITTIGWVALTLQIK